MPTTIEALRTPLVTFARTGRWGTCSACPCLNGEPRPEGCVNTKHYDHNLTLADLVDALRRYGGPQAQEPVPVPRGRAFARWLHKAVMQQLVSLGVTRSYVEDKLREFVAQSERRIEQHIKERIDVLIRNRVDSRWGGETAFGMKAVNEAFEAAARKLIEERFAAGLSVNVVFNAKEQG